jgi:hypothetical protein
MRRVLFGTALVSHLLAGCTERATAVEGPERCEAKCDAGDRGTGGGRSAGGAGNGGARGGGGGAGNAGAPGSGGRANGGAGPDAGPSGGAPTVDFSLVVDAPSDGAAVAGTVVVRGRATGYQNVEVWDATHTKPPMAQVTPNADGVFATIVDTSSLAEGPTTWTVWAWDSPPGQSYDHNENVRLNLTIGPARPTGADSGSPVSGGQTIGTGDIGKPATGPSPSDANKVGGAPFVLVKNWDFGKSGTIRDTAALVSEFLFHDQFGTIANGTKYGSVIVAPNAATAISAPNLGLPGDMQPVEDPARPTREWTDGSLKTYVRPLTPSQTTVSASAHDAGNGSFAAKWKLPNGGALLGKDVLWESRVRIPVPVAAYWFAIWASGNQWNKGAEVDVVESFGTPNVYPPADAFLVNAVGGRNDIDYSSWPDALDTAGVPRNGRDLSAYHVFTWVYRKDDSYTVYFDGIVVQTGSIHWTLGGTALGQSIDLNFLFDFSWGHTDIADENVTLPASSFPLTYEIDYSRVYLR